MTKVTNVTARPRREAVPIHGMSIESSAEKGILANFHFSALNEACITTVLFGF